MKKVWLLAFGCVLLSACEKDDICAGNEFVTPNVVIELYDRLESETPKRAVKIAAIANGFNDTLFFTNSTKIELPLQINTNETSWKLRLYELTPTNDTIHKADELRFNYTPEALYVSKACGYKTIFHDFSTVRVPNTTGNSWIQSIYRATNELTTNEHAHIHLYY